MKQTITIELTEAQARAVLVALNSAPVQGIQNMMLLTETYATVAKAIQETQPVEEPRRLPVGEVKTVLLKEEKDASANGNGPGN